MELSHSLKFIKRYVRDPHVVGAITCSSRALAMALCEPYRQYAGSARVLEVGAGTGAITRYLGSILKKSDRLDICEIQPDFGDILEQHVLTRPDFEPGVREGRIRLLRIPVQQIPAENRYDFIISGLPLTVFELKDVQDVYFVIRRCLEPGGVLSYFEYVGMRRTSRALALGKRRQRIRSVSAYLSDHIRNHQFAQRMVFSNFPPAHARHLRFDNDQQTDSANEHGGSERGAGRPNGKERRSRHDRSTTFTSPS